MTRSSGALWHELRRGRFDEGGFRHACWWVPHTVAVPGGVCVTQVQRGALVFATGVVMTALGFGVIVQAGMSGWWTVAGVGSAAALGGGTAGLLYRKNRSTTRGSRSGRTSGGIAAGLGMLLVPIIEESQIVASLGGVAVCAIGWFLLVAGPIEAFRISGRASSGG